MPPFSDPADFADSTTPSALSTTEPHRSNPQDWEDSGDDDNNRYARNMHGGAPARAFYTGTDVSHELVYLVNDHALDPITVPVSDTASAVAPAEADAEDESIQQGAQSISKPGSDVSAIKGENSTVHQELNHSTAPQDKGEPPLKAPSQHAADAKADAHDRHAEQQHGEHHLQADHVAVTGHHPAPAQDSYQGTSHHDPLLADIIALNPLPASVEPTASADSVLSLPASGELLVPAPEQLFSGNDSNDSTSTSALELNDVVGEEPPASWNSHQPASDEGIVAVMPPVTPTELEQTEMLHLF